MERVDEMLGNKIRDYLRGLRRSPAFRYFKRDIRAKVGFAIVLVVVFTAIFASFVAPYDPIEPHYEDRLQGPSGKYLMGTDWAGRCLFSRIVYGTRYALAVGFLLIAVQASIGVPLGLLAGYKGGRVDNLVMRIVDATLAMPGLIIARRSSLFLAPASIK